MVDWHRHRLVRWVYGRMRWIVVAYYRSPVQPVAGSLRLIVRADSRRLSVDEDEGKGKRKQCTR
jgi:hypothetical protein